MGLKLGIYLGTNDIYGIALDFFDILIFMHFAHFSYTNGQNRARSAQLRRVISREPLLVRRQLSPFWKGDNQGYNIV